MFVHPELSCSEVTKCTVEHPSDLLLPTVLPILLLNCDAAPVSYLHRTRRFRTSYLSSLRFRQGSVCLALRSTLSIMANSSVRWILVDDSYPSIQYRGPWFESSDSLADAGVSGPIFQGSQHGVNDTASFTFSFSGALSSPSRSSFLNTHSQGRILVHSARVQSPAQTPMHESIHNGPALSTARPSHTTSPRSSLRTSTRSAVARPCLMGLTISPSSCPRLVEHPSGLTSSPSDCHLRPRKSHILRSCISSRTLLCNTSRANGRSFRTTRGC